MLSAYVISSQDGQLERQKLQGDDTEDALQTVHSLWQLNGLIGILSHLRVTLATEDDGPTLMETEALTLVSLLHDCWNLTYDLLTCLQVFSE